MKFHPFTLSKYNFTPMETIKMKSKTVNVVETAMMTVLSIGGISSDCKETVKLT